MIKSSKHGVSKVEFFLDEPLKETKADIVRINQWSTPLEGFDCTPFHTRVVYLNEPLDRLLKQLHSDSRRLVQRAKEDDRMIYRPFSGNDRAALDMICSLHSQFAAQKNLETPDHSHTYRLAEAGRMAMSIIEDRDGNVLTWRTYYRDANRVVRGIYSGSLYRSLTTPQERQFIGRANRFNVWQDIARFHEEGVAIFDMGGWYVGEEDEEKIRINRFKKEFGGTVLQQYHGVRAQTWKGKAALMLADFRNRREHARYMKTRVTAEAAKPNPA